MVQFNQRVTGLKASMFATTGRVLSLVHLEPGTKGHADRFILYLEKASHSVDVSLSGYLVTGDEGLYNTPSNTLVIGFRDEHSAVVALSSHFTRSNPSTSSCPSRATPSSRRAPRASPALAAPWSA